MIAYGTVTEDGDFIPDPDYRHFMKRFKGRVRIVQDGKEKERNVTHTNHNRDNRKWQGCSKGLWRNGRRSRCRYIP